MKRKTTPPVHPADKGKPPAEAPQASAPPAAPADPRKAPIKEGWAY